MTPTDKTHLAILIASAISFVVGIIFGYVVFSPKGKQTTNQNNGQ